MAHPNRLQEIAHARGQSVEQMIDEELGGTGSIPNAARSIGVNTWSVRRWIKRNHFDVSPSARLVKRNAEYVTEPQS